MEAQKSAQIIAQAEVFTDLVEKRFAEQPEKFDKFLKTLNDLRSSTGDRTCGVLELKKVFVNHQDLLILLNNFLPKAYHTIPTRVWEEQDMEEGLKTGMHFVNNV